MFKEPEVPLKVETLTLDEEKSFLITSIKEILFILHTIEHKQTRSALYYNDGSNSLITALLAVDESGLWLSPSDQDSVNREVLASDQIVFISSHYHVKIQFNSSKASLVNRNEQPALFIPLPKAILRIQRRDYFRLPVPVNSPLKCLIPTAKPEEKSIEEQIIIMDISVGGIALVCEERGIELKPGEIHHQCHIELPDVGTLTASIEVRNSFEVKTPDGQLQKRAGCEFLKLDGAMAIMLQRYISNMQLQNQDQ